VYLGRQNSYPKIDYTNPISLTKVQKDRILIARVLKRQLRTVQLTDRVRRALNPQQWNPRITIQTSVHLNSPELLAWNHYSSVCYKIDISTTHSYLCSKLLSTSTFSWSQYCCGEIHDKCGIQRSVIYQILGAESECEWVFMAHWLAVLAMTSDWINKITPESSIVPYHSFLMPVSLLCIWNALSPLVTTTFLWISFRRHGPDECMNGKLCLRYCLIDC